MSRRAAGEPVVIAGARVRAAVVPDCGARVVSLARPGGREWLADSGRDWPSVTPRAWADGDVRGWDECFPSIAAGVHPATGQALPDHGEVWNAPWTSSSTARSIVSATRLQHHDIRLRRTLAAGEQFDARYSTTAREALEVAWAMHLLLDADAAALRLPDDAPMRVDSTWGSLAPLPDGWMPWHVLRALLPLDEPSGWACKLFTAPGSVDAVSIDADGETLTVTAIDMPVPHVFGVWINRAGPEGLDVHHMGIEAGFGDHDDLAECIADGSALPLAAGRTAQWHVRIDIAERSAQ